MRYDRTQDPQEHLTAFEARMNLEGVGDEVRCRAFLVTLAGPAIRWFNSFPQGSVVSFSDISRAFLAQFTTRIAKAKHPINLLGVTQKTSETTRKYLDHFNDECLEIEGQPSCCRQQAAALLHSTQAARQWRKTEGHARDGGPSKAPRPFPRVGKFTNYTPLTLPIIEVYQQIAEKGILSKPRLLKDQTGGNKSLYYDYHKGYGHKMQDCYDLKDALEQAIRDGKLAEFSHLIRELRR
ncbi:uncharacterized protein [Arachis hypogaea]|uniref:uncharacterized protein n=1 Tax=Arachis hypogaea TaxID=3818 RepID=UPI000DEC13B0|nr:uncharacterized protein LOC112723530 [Arachis hypogaea]